MAIRPRTGQSGGPILNVGHVGFGCSFKRPDIIRRDLSLIDRFFEYFISCDML